MMSEAADDQLVLALTDWERLMEVGVDLITSHADYAAINALLGSCKLLSVCERCPRSVSTLWRSPEKW